jgi:quercetin dioxygenase-like cupin family protein
MPRSRKIAAAVVFAGCLTLFSSIAGFAQARTMLDKQDLSVPGREGVLVQTELGPGFKEPNHTHPGDVFAYVLEGNVTLTQDGQPTKHLKVGESFFVPEGRIHSASNEGTTPTKLVVTFFVEKGKPLTTPVK